MNKLILGLLAVLSLSAFGQHIEKLDYCACQDKIDQVEPVLNGQFERTCNGILIEKGQFASGQKNGEWISYSRKGKLIRKLNYDNGLLNGKVELFYLTGQAKVTGQFEKGNKTGKWTYYTDKGKILSEGSFDNNKPVGTWIINDQKGKGILVQYDFDAKKYLINNPAPSHKANDVIQNGNTEEWYILRVPDNKYSSQPEPLGGYDFANYMFIELVEVPEVVWNTYVYNRYKIDFKITEENGTTFQSQQVYGATPIDDLEFTFLIVTNAASKLKQIEHSDLETKLLEFKIAEAISLMPPWIPNADRSDIELFVHYAINKNMHP